MPLLKNCTKERQSHKWICRLCAKLSLPLSSSPRVVAANGLGLIARTFCF
jgi:hypothetical protein